jgi:hypothetical protein
MKCVLGEMTWPKAGSVKRVHRVRSVSPVRKWPRGEVAKGGSGQGGKKPRPGETRRPTQLPSE